MKGVKWTSTSHARSLAAMDKGLNYLLIILLSAMITAIGCNHPPTGKESLATDSSRNNSDSLLLAQYAHNALKTNLSKHSIPLDSILDGGVGKNDIPAIDFPEFANVEQAHGYLTDPDYGILLTANGEHKFYPLAILNWHEIINDAIGGRPVLVSFCPLCGTAIVYDRIVNGDTMLFGVSGKLYESNLLMFDEGTESLWSQALGECVAGDLTGKKLSLANSVFVSFEQVQKDYPDAEVLSIKTGYERNYTQDPYSEYVSSDELFFPVSRSDSRYPNKDVMYVVQVENTSVAFHWKDLLRLSAAQQKTADGTVSVKIHDFTPSAIKKEDGSSLKGYFSCWFSWVATYGDQGVVWKPVN